MSQILLIIIIVTQAVQKVEVKKIHTIRNPIKVYLTWVFARRKHKRRDTSDSQINFCFKRKKIISKKISTYLHMDPLCSLKLNIYRCVLFKLTCISFFTTSLPRIWSKTAWRNWSVIMLNFNLSRCQSRTLDSSMAVIDTFKRKVWELN